MRLFFLVETKGLAVCYGCALHTNGSPTVAKKLNPRQYKSKSAKVIKVQLKKNNLYYALRSKATDSILFSLLSILRKSRNL